MLLHLARNSGHVALVTGTGSASVSGGGYEILTVKNTTKHPIWGIQQFNQAFRNLTTSTLTLALALALALTLASLRPPASCLPTVTRGTHVTRRPHVTRGIQATQSPLVTRTTTN